jgi:hypothetical protein
MKRPPESGPRVAFSRSLAGVPLVVLDQELKGSTAAQGFYFSVHLIHLVSRAFTFSPSLVAVPFAFSLSPFLEQLLSYCFFQHDIHSLLVLHASSSDCSPYKTPHRGHVVTTLPAFFMFLVMVCLRLFHPFLSEWSKRKRNFEEPPHMRFVYLHSSPGRSGSRGHSKWESPVDTLAQNRSNRVDCHGESGQPLHPGYFVRALLTRRI